MSHTSRDKLEPILLTTIRPKMLLVIWTTVCIAIATLAFGTFPDLHFEGDDFAYLEDLSTASQNLRFLFSSERSLPGRPATDVVLLAVYETWGTNPTAFHLSLILLHGIATILLVLTCIKTGLDLEISLTGGLFFLINLAHFRALQWISCLAYPLTLSFGLAGCIAFLTFSSRWQWIASLTFVLALLSHPAAILFPAFCTYIAWRNGTAIWPIWIPTVIVLAAIGIAFPNAPQTEHISAVHQLDLIPIALQILWYIGRLWVSTFVLFQNMDQAHAFDLLIGLFVIVGVIALYKYHIFPLANWGVWMILAICIFVTNPNQTHFESGPSRHLYLASAGAAPILAWICRQAIITCTTFYKPARKVLFPSLILIITYLSVTGLKKSEAFAYTLSARAHIARNDLPTGIRLFHKAFERSPELMSEQTYVRLITNSFTLGEFPNTVVQQALFYYPKSSLISALQMVNTFKETVQNRQQVGDQIVSLLQKVPEDIKYDVAAAFLNLGTFFSTQEDHQSAQIAYDYALKLRANYPDAAFNVGMLYVKQGHYEMAAQIFHQILDHNPNHVKTRQNLGNLYYQQQNWERAEFMYKKVLTQTPNQIDIMFNLGVLYINQQRYSSARPLFIAIVKQRPDDWQSYAYLAQCHEAAGNMDNAKANYQKASILKPGQKLIQQRLQELNARTESSP